LSADDEGYRWLLVKVGGPSVRPVPLKSAVYYRTLTVEELI